MVEDPLKDALEKASNVIEDLSGVVHDLSGIVHDLSGIIIQDISGIIIQDISGIETKVTEVENIVSERSATIIVALEQSSTVIEEAKKELGDDK